MGNLSAALLCVSFVFVLARIGEILRRRELLRKQENRPLWSRKTVINRYMGLGYDRFWVEKVYDRISFYLPEGIFLHPEDHFMEDYHIDESDLMEMLTIFYEQKWDFSLSYEARLEADVNGANLYNFEGFLRYLHHDQLEPELL